MIKYSAPKSVAPLLTPLASLFDPLLKERARFSYKVDVRHVGPAAIQALNRRHRGVNRPTDVLSFPLYSSIAELPKADSQLGDLIIAPQLTGGQHLSLLECYLHGTLHLLGFDHETNSKEWLHARQQIPL